MFRKILFVSIMILLLPVASTLIGSGHSPGPFNTTALAGRTTAGGFCECGCSGCICDPGEVATECSDVQSSSNAANAPKAAVGGFQERGFDFGFSTLLAALLLIMMRRMLV